MAVSPSDAARFVARTLGRTSLGPACVRALVALRRTGRIDPGRAMTLSRWIMETHGGTLPLVPGEIELVGRRVRLYSNLKTASGRALLIPPGPCQGEDASLRLFAALARGARVVFDVGANVGLYTYTAALHSPASAVHAIEPNPRLAELIRLNVRAQRWEDRVTVHERAVLDHGGSVELIIGKSDHHSTVLPGILPEDRIASRQPVEAITLDDACAAAGADPGTSLFKIDTEGAEERVLAGFSGGLAHPAGPELIIELWRASLQNGVISRLRALGFRAFLVARDGLIPIHGDADALDIAPDGFYNYYFTKRDEPALRFLREEGLLSRSAR